MVIIENLMDWMGERRRDILARVQEMFGSGQGKSDQQRSKGPGYLSSEAALLQPLRPSRVPENVCVYAIGDIHGRADLLLKLVDIIRKDVAERNDPSVSNALVFLGDYVDRGFQSKQVLDILTSKDFDDFEMRFLKGNHEETFMEFLYNPSIGARWSQYGGMETLVSYGVQPPRSREDFEDWERTRRDFVEALPDTHRTFMEELEVCLVLGDYVFVHAGLRPGKSIEEQSPGDLMWIRDEFLYHKDPFEKVVVHGHTPINEPHHDFRRISVDTGAYLSGRLTAARLFGDTVEFIST